MKQKAIIIFLSVFLLYPFFVFARENVDYWYIKDFESEIVVDKDSSLTITEKITADCGQAIGKHGIFRILPTQIRAPEKRIETPVKLLSITDFNGRPVKYSTISNHFQRTITWKIGDPSQTVQGVNYYQIKYTVQNAIRFDSNKSDEFYWNLNGNFWDLEIDNFRVKIIFPSEVRQDNSTVEYYTGYLGSKDKNLASYVWSAPNVLEFYSAGTILKGQSITTSVIFPKNIFTPYQESRLKRYGNYFSLIISILAFINGYYFWRKYGKDPQAPKVVIAQYEPPEGLSPVELGVLMTNGTLKNQFITAEIINLAVKGLITIKEIEKRVIIFSGKDFLLTKNNKSDVIALLNPIQKLILDNIFTDTDTVSLSSLKKDFYTCLIDIRSKTKKILEDKRLIEGSGLKIRTIFTFFGVLFSMLGIVTMVILFNIFLALGFLVSGILFFVFGHLMPKRTLKGANANWQIKGFKLYMETAEKYRERFYEKENIFEKFLPYAIVFGITGLWIKKMQEIYGRDFYATYVPVWYAGSIASFDVNSLNAVISSLSSSIASNVSSGSGAGGIGGAGGGGGGGGGGGW